MSSKFRDLLESRIRHETLECASTLVESHNDNLEWIGRKRGYIEALKDVLTWSTEIERDLNNA